MIKQALQKFLKYLYKILINKTEIYNGNLRFRLNINKIFDNNKKSNIIVMTIISDKL